MKLLVCGSRKFDDWDTFRECIVGFIEGYGEIDCIIEGGATGADAMGKRWAVENGKCHIQVNANWDYYQKAAGPIRNQWMLDFCNPDKVIAFPDAESRGTWDMVQKASDAGLEVIVAT